MNRKVLIISYNFPPDGCGAVQRVTKFCKYLTELGWELHVLTAKGYKHCGKDSSLLNELNLVKIHRTYDKGAFTPGEIRHRIKKLNHPDRQITWSKSALKTAKKLCRRYKFAILFTTSPPHSTQLLGLKIKSYCPQLKWVADFRDEWIFNPNFENKRFKNEQIEWEKEVLDKADHIVCNTPVMRNHFKTILNQNKFTVIRNGFDPDDFSLIDWNKVNEVKSKRDYLLLSYAGRLNGLHDPTDLLNAANGLIKTEKHIPKFKMEFITNKNSFKWLDSFTNMLIKNVLHKKGYMPHKNCLEELAYSNILLLLTSSNCTVNFIPGKIYEYLYLNIPILGVIPEHSPLVNFARKFPYFFIANPNSINDIQMKFQKVLNYINDDHKRSFHFRGGLTDYKRKYLTLKLSKIFDLLLEGTNE